MRQIKLILTLIIFLFSSLSAQRPLKITVNVEGRNDYLSYLVRNGTSYVSSKETAKLLLAGYYYNTDAAKAEIKFDNYNIKFTARNQYVVITSHNGDPFVFQLPISTLLIRNDVFIPLVYCIDYLGFASGRKLFFNEREKDLTISSSQFDSDSFLKSISNDKGITEIGSNAARTIPLINTKYDIYDVNIEEKTNGTLIRLKTSKKINIPRQSINNGVLYVFLSKTSVAPGIFKSVKNAGLVKDLRVKNLSPNNIQLEFGLKDGYSTSEAFQDIESSDILITIHNKLFAANTAGDLEGAKTKWVFDAVVIDAGHGGKDPGAIGVTGTKEKDINLGIALKLGKLIETNMKDIKVIYTRKTDTFVELYKRGKIANENGGKLFISIHCNSTPHKPTNLRGFEVYLLRPGRTKEAIEIAEFENSVIKYEDNPERYQKLTDENFILVSMAHSQYMRYSEKFSDILNQQWGKNVNIPSLGIKQAGFYVLVGASMPGVLIENGFLSNRNDERFLKSSSGQAEIARAIFIAVKKYKTYYDEMIQEEE